MNLSDAFKKEVGKDQPTKAPCKGRVYRGKVNTHFNGVNFRHDQSLVLLKRQSCKGCDECEWIEEMLTEDCYNEPYQLHDIVNGATYVLSFVGGGEYRTACGLEYEAPEIVFTKQEQNKS